MDKAVSKAKPQPFCRAANAQRFVDDTWLYDRHGTRLCAHAPNPAMHKTSAANTATLNIASIMLPLH
jgi:hypothetical protein